MRRRGPSEAQNDSWPANTMASTSEAQITTRGAMELTLFIVLSSWRSNAPGSAGVPKREKPFRCNLDPWGGTFMVNGVRIGAHA